MDTSNLLTEAEKQVENYSSNKKWEDLLPGESSDAEQGGAGEVHQGAGDQQGCAENRRPCR